MLVAPKKTRVPMPQAIRSKILDEFNHRCAICGADKPQIHHIDEDPSNNDLFNLIPICPNCHLNDQHNPTRQIEPAKLKLFRQHKDPTILKPQFHPLFVRLQFLERVTDDSDTFDHQQQAHELIEFVAELEMGGFYAKRIKTLLHRQHYPAVGSFNRPDMEQIRKKLGEQKRKEDAQYRAKLRDAKEPVYSLVVELLRFQKW